MLKSLEAGLASAGLRLARARKHLEEFEELEAAYVATDPIKFHISPLADGGGILSFATLKDPPTDLGAAADDAIGNMRESLDHTLFAFAEVSGITTEAGMKALQFPTGETPELFEKVLPGRTKGIDSRVVDTVRAAKPFLDPNDPENPGSWLQYLHELSNPKKHRIISSTPVFSGYAEMHISQIYMGPKLQQWVPAGHQAICAFPDTGIKAALVPGICFPGNEGLFGKRAADQMNRIHEVCTETVASFKALAEREFP